MVSSIDVNTFKGRLDKEMRDVRPTFVFHFSFSTLIADAFLYVFAAPELLFCYFFAI